MVRGMLLGLLLCVGGNALAQPAWLLRESVNEERWPALLFGVEGVAGSMRLDCLATGAMLRVWTRPPRHGRAASDGGPTFLSLFMGRREFRSGATLVHEPGDTWVVEAPVPNPAEFLMGIRAVPRIVVVTHAGRLLAPVPEPGLVDRFERACLG